MSQEKDTIILNQISTNLFTLQRLYIVSSNTSSEFGQYPSLIMYRKIEHIYDLWVKKKKLIFLIKSNFNKIIYTSTVIQ
jgi:hypothetical protein